MEFVYVVPRPRLFPDRYPQGLVPFGSENPREAFMEAVLEHGFFVERPYAERTPELKQVIPYNVVTRADAVLLLRRTKAGGDRRLHDKLSIGVGGHVNPEDAGPSEEGATASDDRATRGDLLERASTRELSEELILEGVSRIEPVGLINDDSNPVGAVHVGLVQILATEGPVGIREREVLEGDFVSTAELAKQRSAGANFETWSAMLVDRIDDLLLHVQSPTYVHS